MKTISTAKLKEMSEKPTEQLTNEIMNTDDLEDYLKLNALHLGKISLSEELNRLLDLKGMKKTDVIEVSGLTSSYVYDLFSGYKNKSPSRNIILALALAMKLDMEQTQRLLKISDHGALYPRDPRDSVIMFAINNGLSKDETDELLFEKGLETL